MRIISTLVLIWLVVGTVAAFQRGYFSTADAPPSSSSRGDPHCSDIGTVVVTIAAGPLNYFGANPKIDCKTPEPSP
jgi:hypothetical protein